MGHPIDWNSVTEPLGRSMDHVASQMLRQPQIRYRLDLEARKLANETAMAQARVSSEAAQAGNYTAQARGHNADADRKELGLGAFKKLMAGGGFARLHAVAAGNSPLDTRQYDQDVADMIAAFPDDVKNGRDALALIKEAAIQQQQSQNPPGSKDALGVDRTAVVNQGSRNETTITNNAADNVTSRENNTERMEYSLKRPMSVSRDSGVWNPETKQFDVPKPDRPSGNVNNLYSPADRAVLTKAGTDLVEEQSKKTPNQEKITRLNNLIKTTEAKYGKPAGATVPPAAKFNAITAPAANQMQDHDDSELPELPAEEATPAAAPAAGAVIAPQPLDAELKLAQDAIKQGANPAKVAAKFKARTGKDLPQ